MAQDCSFDVVSQVDMQGMDNAVNQAMKETFTMCSYIYYNILKVMSKVKKIK